MRLWFVDIILIRMGVNRLQQMQELLEILFPTRVGVNLVMDFVYPF
jgi:hypothetical protein